MDFYNLENSYPDKVPVIVLDSKSLKKFLIPKATTLNEFIYLYRKKTHMNSKKSIYVEIKGRNYLSFNTTFKDLYDNYKNEDGLLYLNVIKEKYLGN